MKKNLRIVSAAAAALLAVAPVAAAAVAQPATVSATTVTTVNSKLPSLNQWKRSGSDAGSIGEMSATDPANITAVTTQIQNGVAEQVKGNPSEIKITLVNGTPTRNSDGSYDYKFRVSTTNSNWFGWNAGYKADSADTNTPVLGWNDETNHKGELWAGKATGAKNFTAGTNALATFTVHVVKDTSSVVGKKEPANSYFATSKGNALANNQVVYATRSENENLFSKLASKDGKISIDALKHGIKAVLNNNQPSNLLDSYAFGQGNATTDANLISQLEQEGIKVNGTGNSATFDANTKTLSLLITTNGGLKVTVVFNNENAVDEAAPVLLSRDSASEPWELLQTANGHVFAVNVTQNDDATKWQPSELFSAWNNSKQNAHINVSFSDSNVDITKPGIYHITVTATNAAKKTTTAVVPVIVSAANGVKKTVANDTNIYTKDASGKMVQSNILNYAHLNNGQQVRVFDEVTVDGVQYYRIFSKNSNFFVKASDLKGYVAPNNNTSAANAVSKTIMHVAAFYDKTGKRLSDPVVHAYNSISVLPTTVKINGKDFYQVVENGKAVEKYVKASNIDATRRTLKHNSYVYKSNGKTYMKSKKHHEVVKSGSSVNTYGGQLKVNGSMMYRIGRNRYIKVANFR